LVACEFDLGVEFIHNYEALCEIGLQETHFFTKRDYFLQALKYPTAFEAAIVASFFVHSVFKNEQ
jgi:hypothetical protein